MTSLTSAHTDTFAKDNLPPKEQWPDLLLDDFPYPDCLNAGYELTDAVVEAGFGFIATHQFSGTGRTMVFKTV